MKSLSGRYSGEFTVTMVTYWWGRARLRVEVRDGVSFNHDRGH